MKTVLCFGDSNTWGAATVPRPDGRYGPEERWPGVMRSVLGAGWQVIEEGLPGRTTVNDDYLEGEWLNGARYLRPCLRTHRPVDIVIIMLGTNDLKHRFNKSAWDIAESNRVLIDVVRSTECGREGADGPDILLVCPPPTADHLPGNEEKFAGAQAKSRELARFYADVAERTGVRFLDAGRHIRSSTVDGFHLDPEAHAVLGKVIAAEVAAMAAGTVAA